MKSLSSIYIWKYFLLQHISALGDYGHFTNNSSKKQGFFSSSIEPLGLVVPQKRPGAVPKGKKRFHLLTLTCLGETRAGGVEG